MPCRRLSNERNRFLDLFNGGKRLLDTGKWGPAPTSTKPPTERAVKKAIAAIKEQKEKYGAAMEDGSLPADIEGIYIYEPLSWINVH